MATYYARNVTGNWASTTSWDSASSGGAGPAGPPVAGDTAIFDSGFTGNITVAAAAACTTLTVQSGATGTLTWGAYTLSVAGSVTFVSGFNLAGSTGRLALTAAGTITSGGLTLPGNMTIAVNGTFPLVGNLTVAGQFICSASVTFSGAYDISVADLVLTGTLSLVEGRTFTVTNSVVSQGGLTSSGVTGSTLKSATGSSTTNLTYNGSVANCKCYGTTFTDVTYSGSTMTWLPNWQGGTLTRTEGIYNVTPSSFPAVGDVKNAVAYGGVDDASANRLTGTYSAGVGGGGGGFFRGMVKGN